MRKEIFNGKEIEIAESAKDIKIAKLADYITNNKNVKSGSIEFKQLLTVFLTSLTIDEVDNSPYADIRTLMSTINDESVNFETAFIPEVVIDGVTYTAKLTEGMYVLKIKDSKLLEALILKYKVDFINYLPAIIFRNDWSTPNTLEEIEANKDIFKDITGDVIGPYVMYICNVINEKGI